MKKYFFTGLVILMPVVLTLVVIFFLFNLFTTPFVGIVGKLFSLVSQTVHFTLSPNLTLFVSRILAFLMLIAFIFILGVIAQWFLIKHLLSGTHILLSRIPFIKTVYKASRDIIVAIFSNDGKKVFKHPVMIPFPHRPIYYLGFQVGEIPEEIQNKISTPLIPVFTPTVPHPISGFLFLVPEKDVHTLDMTNEEAVKYLVSCALFQPGTDR